MKKQSCIIEGCKKTIEIKIHKLCKSHYQRYYRTGSIGKEQIRHYKRRKPLKIYDPKNDKK